MKIKTTLLFILFAATLSAAPDEERTLHAIAQREDVQDYTQVGSAGERGIYHMMSDTWYRYSDLPFEIASTKDGQKEAHRVAVCHLRHLETCLQRRGSGVNVYSLAVLWNAGETRWNHHRLLERQREYGRAVANLYDSP